MRKIALMLVFMILTTCFSGAFAETVPTEYTSGDYTYIVLEDGNAQITGYTGTAETLEIPAQLDGYAVTSIGYHAFFNCWYPVQITIPDSITAIDDYAFEYCNSLTEITIPDSVVCIGANPFKDCHALDAIVVSPSHPALETIDGVLFDKINKTLICYPMVFENESYVIPEGTLGIGDAAFFHCESLTQIAIPNRVAFIGSYAFCLCASLEQVTMPDGVAAIGDYAFSDCRKLTQITIPDGVVTIGDYAFRLCSGLTQINLPDGLVSLGVGSFTLCENLTQVTIPDSVTFIGEFSFSGDRLFISYDEPTLIVEPGSYAETYAQKNDLPYELK